MMDYYGIAYALVVASGGVFGYVKTGSTPSLVAGLLFGSAIAYGSYQVSRNGYHIPALATSAALSGMMGYRFYSTQKIMPAGLLTTISVCMAIKYATMAITAKPMRPLKSISTSDIDEPAAET